MPQCAASTGKSCKIFTAQAQFTVAVYAKCAGSPAMHVAEAFLPVKVCLEAAPGDITAATVAQTVRACTAALGAKPYQARREAAETLRVLAASVAAGAGPAADARRELDAQRDGVISALQVTNEDVLLLSADASLERRTAASTGRLTCPVFFGGADRWLSRELAFASALSAFRAVDSNKARQILRQLRRQFAFALVQKARYDKIQHVREAAVAALAEFGAVATPPAAKQDRARRKAGIGSASSLGRGSAARHVASENLPPWSRSPLAAGGSGAVESPRLPLASSFNRPRVRRSVGGKLQHALDFSIEVFAPAGPPPLIAAEHQAPAPMPGSAAGSPTRTVPGPYRDKSPLAAGACCQTGAKAVIDGCTATQPPGRKADHSDLQQLHDASDVSSSLAKPTGVEQAYGGQTAPQVSYRGGIGDAVASAGRCEHKTPDGITLSMWPSHGEVNVRLLDSYMG